MKKLLLSTILSGIFLSINAQQDTIRKEFLIKYEVLTKKGEVIAVTYFDKNGNNAGATASELWTYTFSTSDKNQNIQVFTTGGQAARSMRKAKVWTKVNIYVNGKLIKSEEGKVLGAGPTVQIDLTKIN